MLPSGQESDRASRVVAAPARRGRRSRRLNRRLQDRLDRALGWLLVTTILVSVLAVGTVHVGVLVPVSVLGLLAGGYALFRELGEGRSVPGAALVAASLAGYTLLQAAPLPQPLVRFLSPPTGEIWAGSLGLIDAKDRIWVSLSLNPSASVVEGLKWLLYASVVVAAVRVGRLRGSSLIPAAIFGAAVLCAVLAVVHRLSGAQRLYGIYQPDFAHPRFSLAPLLNSNNFAGYLNLGAFAGLGLLFARDVRLPRWAIAFAVSLILGLSAALGSRGGMLSLIVGVVVLPLAFWRRRHRMESWRMPAISGAAVAGGLLLFGLAATEDVWQALLGEGAHKFALFSWTRSLVSQHFFLGVGRGAFQSAFPAYRGDSAHHIYTFAENFILQWSSEWGVPVAVAALAGFAWTLRPSRLVVRRGELGICCVVGILVLLLHNLVDLALEVPAVSIALFALLGGLVGANQRGSNQSVGAASKLSETSLRGMASAFCVLSAGVVVATLVWARSTVVEKRAQVADLLGQRGREAQALAEVKSAIQSYPADPYFPLAGGIIALRVEDNPLPWLGRAIERDPMSGRPYLLLSYALAGMGLLDQAAVPLRMAAEREAPFKARSAALALRLGEASGDLLRAVPSEKKGIPLLLAMAARVDRKADPELRRRLLEEVLARDKGHTSATLERSKDLLNLIQQDAPECAHERRSTCIRGVEALLDDLASGPPDTRVTIVRARLLLLAGRPTEALRTLRLECSLPNGDLDCFAWQVRAAELVGKDQLVEASGAYLARACSTPKTCESGGAWLANRHIRRGDAAGALRIYERVAREADSPESWRRVAIAAARAGFAGLAAQALVSYRASGGQADPELAEQVAKVRARVMNSAHSLQVPAGLPRSGFPKKMNGAVDPTVQRGQQNNPGNPD